MSWLWLLAAVVVLFYLFGLRPARPAYRGLVAGISPLPRKEAREK